MPYALILWLVLVLVVFVPGALMVIAAVVG